MQYNSPSFERGTVRSHSTVCDEGNFSSHEECASALNFSRGRELIKYRFASLRFNLLLMRSSICLCLLSLFSKRDERNIVQRREFAAQPATCCCKTLLAFEEVLSSCIFTRMQSITYKKKSNRINLLLFLNYICSALIPSTPSLSSVRLS